MALTTRLFFWTVPWIRSPFRSKRVLILRLDAIGDYILFRNFLETLAHDDLWKQYRITLLGNVAFRDIAKAFDTPYVSEFIWIDPSKLGRIIYLLSIVFKLKIRGFDLAINPIHARGPVHDHLLLFSGSKKIIGTSGDLLGYADCEAKKKSDSYYDQLIAVPDHSHFEFFRNRAFFEVLTKKPDRTALALPFTRSKYIDPTKVNVVLFPDAADTLRRWPISSFASLISIMQKNDPDNLRFIIAGNSEDCRIAVDFPVVDLIGRTSLIELIDLIGSCQLLISNETSAVHIAAATGAPAICISNGNHFGRFNPYPREITDKIITVYPLDQFYSNDKTQINELVEACKVRSEIDIKLITVARLINIVKDKISDISPFFSSTHFQQ